MPAEFHISIEKGLLNTDFIHDYMTESSYWAKGRTREQTLKTIENSYCFGMYNVSDKQIGFAREVTDFVFFGNIMDVIIDPEYQGKGLEKRLVEYILNDLKTKGLQTITLKTKDAHTLYEKYGFEKIGGSPLYMAMDKQKLE